MGARNGKAYLDSLDNMQREIWLDGEKLTQNLSQYPLFSGIAKSMAQLYDMQHDPLLIDQMTYNSPTTGDRVGMSFLEPKTMEDVAKRRIMMKNWADWSGGMLGRTPDYKNSELMAWASAAEVFGRKDPRFAENIKRYYEYVRENDLLLTHALLAPQVNRSALAHEQKDQFIAAKVVEKNTKGIVIRGARYLATFPLADEIIVFPPPPLLEQVNFSVKDIKTAALEAPYMFAFSISVETPGLKFICRESFSKKSIFDHPLAARFDEQDAVVVFDDVLVPWDRVFLLEDIEGRHAMYAETDARIHMTHQVLIRRVAKTEFLLGVICKVAEMIGIDQFPNVHEKIIKVIMALDTMKALLVASEANAKVNRWGVMTPDDEPLATSRSLYPLLYPQIREIIQQLSAGGLMALPTELSMDSAIREDIDKYYQGKNANSEERIKLFHLCWDIAGSSFGSRQELYERFFSGDPLKTATAFYYHYDKAPVIKKVEEFLNRKI